MGVCFTLQENNFSEMMCCALSSERQVHSVSQGVSQLSEMHGLILLTYPELCFPWTWDCVFIMHRCISPPHGYQAYIYLFTHSPNICVPMSTKYIVESRQQDTWPHPHYILEGANKPAILSLCMAAR